jgi:hypothetical protein
LRIVQYKILLDLLFSLQKRVRSLHLSICVDELISTVKKNSDDVQLQVVINIPPSCINKLSNNQISITYGVGFRQRAGLTKTLLIIYYTKSLE